MKEKRPKYRLFGVRMTIKARFYAKQTEEGVEGADCAVFIRNRVILCQNA